ncbi:cytochrome P450 [Streptomyces sp. NPDC051320]|uniref:cytochrome P450 n=1 Tax=Streptomyces sp. NPDC051320 TaxID=3154644 RepID=UPI00344A493A
MPKQLTMPPGPADDVDLEQMRHAPLEFVTGLARTYGDVTRHTADGDTVYLLNRPDLARHVLKDNGANYTKEQTPDDHMLRPLLGNGLLTSNGEEWARQRHQCAPAFRPGAVKAFDTVITEATHHLLERWEPAVTAGTPLAVDHHLAALTLTIVTRAILGTDLDGVGEGFGQAVDAVNRCIGHYVPPEDPDPADTARRQRDFAQARMFLSMVTSTLIGSHRVAGGPGNTLLDAMLNGPHQLSDGELRDEVLTLIMAGHETTAKSLTWTLFLLDRNPQEAARVREEVDRVLAGRIPTAADLAELPLCRRAVQEAMRLYPPVWLTSRRAREADVVDGYDVEPGTLMCISQWVLHRDPRYWDRPDAYHPDRFAEPVGPSHLYMPFGGGDRVCIGQHFAMVEAVLVLAMLTQRVRLELVDGFPVEPEALVTLRPKHGMRMIARSR